MSPKIKGGNKPSQKCQALLEKQLRPRSRQGKNNFFSKLEKDAKTKPHKEKTKRTSPTRGKKQKEKRSLQKTPKLMIVDIKIFNPNLVVTRRLPYRQANRNNLKSQELENQLTSLVQRA